MNKASIRQFHKRLQRWYDTHGRKQLPWRNTRDPYAIYISEIMLQQTQVNTVLERYYQPFLQQFPTIGKLAAAPERDVLKAWQGLGYYNRASNLHEAAKTIEKARSQRQAAGGEASHALCTHPSCPLPVASCLQTLPGVGRNTAHAVAAFAYHQPFAVMEANVKRVLCRIFSLQNPKPDALWEYATQLLDEKNPFDYNQAMMDIGSLICTRRAPKCGECPAQNICQGKFAPELYPAAKIKKTVPVRRKIIIVEHNEKGQYFAEPRMGKFLNGLYCFTEIDSPPPARRIPSPSKRKVREKADSIFLGHVRQQYSHFTLEADVYLQKSKGSGKNWHGFKALQQLPFSKAEWKILALLQTLKTDT